jgi:hypothetical protein
MEVMALEEMLELPTQAAVAVVVGMFFLQQRKIQAQAALALSLSGISHPRNPFMYSALPRSG